MMEFFQSPVTKVSLHPTFPRSHLGYHSSRASVERKGNHSIVTRATAPSCGSDVLSLLTLDIYLVQRTCAEYFKERIFHLRHAPDCQLPLFRGSPAMKLFLSYMYSATVSLLFLSSLSRSGTTGHQFKQGTLHLWRSPS